MHKSYNIISDDVRKKCLDEISGLELDKFEVIIQRRGKTPAQRRYWHMCLAIVSQAYGDTMERVKHMIKENVIGYDEWTDRKGNKHKRVKSSEELTDKEYSELIDYTHIVANHVGCVLPDPSQYGYELN